MRNLQGEHGENKGRRASGWVRLHRDALHNPKVGTLSDRQHRVWINLLLLSNDAGALPKVRDIAWSLRLSVQETETVIGELVDAELVDVVALTPAKSFRMHDWDAHQYKSDVSTERVRKFRSKNKDETPRNGDETPMKRRETVSVTPPEAETEAETEKEKKELRAVRTAPRVQSTEEVDQQFEDFWRAFPSGRKKGKGKAKVLFRQIVRGGHHTLRASADTLIAAAKAYADTKPDPQYTPMPQTWLAGGRWDDDLAGGKSSESTPAKPVAFDWSTAPEWMREANRELNGRA